MLRALVASQPSAARPHGRVHVVAGWHRRAGRRARRRAAAPATIRCGPGVSHDRQRRRSVRDHADDRRRPFEARAVIVATPAWAAAPMLARVDPELAAAVRRRSRTPRPPRSPLALRRDQVRHPLDGTGFVVPRVERRALMAGDVGVVEVAASRAAWPRAAARLSSAAPPIPTSSTQDDEALARSAFAELAALLGIAGEPLFTRVYRWPRASAAVRRRSSRSACARSIERLDAIPGSVRHRQRLSAAPAFPTASPTRARPPRKAAAMPRELRMHVSTRCIASMRDVLLVVRRPLALLATSRRTPQATALAAGDRSAAQAAFAPPTRASWPSRKRTDGSCACSSRRPARSACSRSARPAATAPSGWAWACGRPAASWSPIEYDPRARARRPPRTSAAPACRTSCR